MTLPSEAPSQHWTPGRLNAPVGTREWADAVRLKLVSKVEHLGEDDESFVSWLEVLTEHRAWSLLTKRDGSTFHTREEFCAYDRPWGLGTPWEKLRPFVRAAYAKRGMGEPEIDRALALDGVPEPEPPKPGPGRGHKAPEPSAEDGPLFETRASEEKTSRNECGRFSKRQVEFLRAINRAPDAVRDAYREGRLSQVLAAKLGPKNPDPDTAAKIAEIAREVARAPDRGSADAIVRERLGVERSISVQLPRHPERAAARLLDRLGREFCRDLVIALDAAVNGEPT